MENNNTLATELLHELKATSRRWFIIAIIELVVILGVVSAFLWYISLPIEDCITTVTQESDNLSRNLIIEGSNYGGEANSYSISKEKSSAQ